MRETKSNIRFTFLIPSLVHHSSFSLSFCPCYSQVVPKSHKYFSLPAGKSLDSKFPPGRLSYTGETLKPPLTPQHLMSPFDFTLIWQKTSFLLHLDTTSLLKTEWMNKRTFDPLLLVVLWGQQKAVCFCLCDSDTSSSVIIPLRLTTRLSFWLLRAALFQQMKLAQVLISGT